MLCVCLPLHRHRCIRARLGNFGVVKDLHDSAPLSLLGYALLQYLDMLAEFD